MSYFRLGMSESSLLFLYYIENEIDVKYYDKNLLIGLRKQLFNWFYSTSGFFDVNIKGHYFDFNMEYDNIIKTNTYNQYFSNLLNFIKNNDFDIFYFRCHDIGVFMNFLPSFIKYINKPNFTNDEKQYNIEHIINNNFKDKNVLLIHNLSELMIEQYNNGNLKKINLSFPEVKNLYPLKIGYTFLNTPLDNCSNILERGDIINSVIQEYIKMYNIDFIIISCGAYSSLISSKIHNRINYCMIGGELEKQFGIVTNRHKESINITKYHISVPEELKPSSHKLIENSCYW
jgi:hypothetical protein